MSEKTEHPPASGGAAPVNAPSSEEAEAIVRALALVYSNATLYGLTHKVTKKSADDAFVKIAQALEAYGEVNFSLVDDVLMVNGTAVAVHNPLTHSFVQHLVEIESPSFSIEKGLAPERFADLVEILNAKPDELRQLGGVGAVLESAQIEHIRAKKMIYKRIAEDDVVLSKEKMEGIAAASEGDIDTVVAFLKSDGAEGDKETAKRLKKVAADSSRMGQLIVDTAEARKAAQGPQSDESLAGMVVDSLQRVFKEMARDPSAKTQKGKKELEKTLALLEDSVKHRIQEIAGEISSEDVRKISDAVENMTDDLRIDALVVEYMKKREALGKNEQRLLNFMKKKGLDRLSDTELESRLTSGGLTAEDWQELLLKSGLVSGGKDGAVPVVGPLAELLSTIQASVGTTAKAGAEGAPKEHMEQLVTRIDAEVKTLVQKTRVKIQSLIESLKADREAADAAEQEAARSGKGPRVSRKRLFEVLAEIGQELCQPLAVISCSVDMMIGGSLGAVTGPQKDMLKLASESAQKLKVLIDNLIEIAGVPETHSPDAAIQASLYEGRGKE